MTTVPGDLAPKLRKLLPRLATNHDGEVVATARAIRRTLAGAGCDLHDLAGAIDRPEPLPRSYSRHPDPDGHRRDRARVRWLLAMPSSLRPREREFLISLLDRIDAGRAPSFRQSAWLADIHDRVSREYA